MQELHVFVTGALVKILKAQLHHAEQSAKSQKFSKEVRNYLEFFEYTARLERGKVEKKPVHFQTFRNLRDIDTRDYQGREGERRGLTCVIRHYSHRVHSVRKDLFKIYFQSFKWEICDS